MTTDPRAAFLAAGGTIRGSIDRQRLAELCVRAKNDPGPERIAHVRKQDWWNISEHVSLASGHQRAKRESAYVTAECGVCGAQVRVRRESLALGPPTCRKCVRAAVSWAG